jgi:DNA polymerase IV
MEDVGIDEAYLDLSEMPDTNEQVANRIKTGIRENTGLTCSIGIAPNKLLAKIASDMQKSDSLAILTREDIETKIWPLLIQKLYGVGPETEAHLTEAGISTIGQLAALPIEKLIDRFGNSNDHYLYDASRAMDDSPLITHWEPSRSMSRETTFQGDVRNWRLIAGTLADLARAVHTDIKEHGYKTRTITIKIRFSDFETFTRAVTIPDYTDSEEETRRAAFACLKRIELNRKVRLVGVRASNLQGKYRNDQHCPELSDRLIGGADKVKAYALVSIQMITSTFQLKAHRRIGGLLLQDERAHHHTLFSKAHHGISRGVDYIFAMLSAYSESPSNLLANRRYLPTIALTANFNV